MLPGIALLLWLTSSCSLQSVAASLSSQLNCNVSHVSIRNGVAGMPLDGIFSFDIYSPVGDDNCSSGEFPVIFFATGFAAAVPAALYSDLLTRIIQRGFIVIGVHRVGMPKYKMEGQKFLEMLEWTQAGRLQTLMAQQKVSATPDLARTAVMGQSAGNHVIGEALVMNCSIVKAFVMIDPVDGADPYGIDKSQNLITPGMMLNFSTPALLLDNALDPKRLNFLFPACAPAYLSNDRFYDAWQGPIWNINATAYGHIDCLNDGDSGVVGHLVCPGSKADKSKYRAMLADATVVFLTALFQDRPDQIKVLEDPSHFSIDVILKHDMKGLPYSQIKPGCVNDKPRDARLDLV